MTSIISKFKTYTITETIQQGLIFDQNSLYVYLIKNDGTKEELNTDAYSVNYNNQEAVINFDTQKINGYKQIILEYETKFDYYNVKEGIYTSEIKLEYTNYIDINGEEKSTNTKKISASVYTASVLVLKTDENGTPLKNAKFKIATSEENAKNNVFIKDINGNDVETTSDENGYIVFNGLKIGAERQEYDTAQTSYWIVETQSPSYQENDEKKYYNLLKKPVEVVVNKESGTYSKDKTTVVVNKKGFILPLTGGKINIISFAIGLCIILIAILLKIKEVKKNEKNKQK